MCGKSFWIVIQFDIALLPAVNLINDGQQLDEIEYVAL